MRGRIVAAMMLAALLACDDDDTGPTAEVYTATLSGAAEVPANNSAGTGTFRLTVNPNRTLTYDLTVSGITPTNQHIHGPATPTTSAGVIVGLTVGTNQTLIPTNFTGTVSYDSLLVLLANGRAYVNVHTAAIPAGEIRGNLVRQ